MRHYPTKTAAMQDVAARHQVGVDDLDIIPHPKLEATYVSYGPADADVELVQWDEENTDD